MYQFVLHWHVSRLLAEHLLWVVLSPNCLKGKSFSRSSCQTYCWRKHLSVMSCEQPSSSSSHSPMSTSTFMAFAEVEPWDGDPATLKFWIYQFHVWYNETGKIKFNRDVKKACHYMLLCLREKGAHYAELKLNELNNMDDDHAFWEETLDSLLANLQEFFKIKTNAQQALKQLKRMHQSGQSIDEFLWDWLLKKWEAAVDNSYVIDLLQQINWSQIFTWLDRISKGSIWFGVPSPSFSTNWNNHLPPGSYWVNKEQVQCRWGCAYGRVAFSAANTPPSDQCLSLLQRIRSFQE